MNKDAKDVIKSIEKLGLKYNYNFKKGLWDKYQELIILNKGDKDFNKNEELFKELNSIYETMVKDLITGIKSKNPLYSNEQILKGVNVELEHTKNKKVALKIALDHLNEFPSYYDELEKMEERLREQSGRLTGDEFDKKIKTILAQRNKERELRNPSIKKNPSDVKKLYIISWFQGRCSVDGKSTTIRHTHAVSKDQALHFVIYSELKDFGYIYYNEKKYSISRGKTADESISDIASKMINISKTKSKPSEYLSIDIDKEKLSNPIKKEITSKKELKYRVKKENGLFYIYYQISLTGTWVPSTSRGHETKEEALEFIKNYCR